jgi:hypothetical protein
VLFLPGANHRSADSLENDAMPLFLSLHRSKQRQSHINCRQNYRPLLEWLEDRLAPSVSVLSYHDSNANIGVNASETILTPANVNVNTFGKLFSTRLDGGQVYAQPLYVSNVLVTVGSKSSTHNVVYVATELDSLYAVDADNGKVLWHDSFINPENGITPIPSSVLNTTDLAPNIGITSTPVIDPSTNTIYVSVATKEVVGTVNHYVQRLHAIDIGTGQEKLGGPVTIADTIFDGTNYTYVSGPSVAGTGAGSVNGRITLNVLTQGQRPGLTLVNGSIYVAFASHNDIAPFHGWVISYNKASLVLNGVFNSTPNGSDGGIWMSGAGIASDSQGNLYFTTGNGTFDTTFDTNGFPSNGDYGDSVIKMVVDHTTSAAHPGINGWGLKVADYFTPFNQAKLAVADLDVSSGGVVILPDAVGSTAHPHLLIIAGKTGELYLIDRDNMGHFDPKVDHVVEETPLPKGEYGSAAYVGGTFFYATEAEAGEAFSISDGEFNPVPTSKTPDTFSYPGSTPIISTNGGAERIVWDLDRATRELRAYNALNLADELYTSAQAPNGRDRLGPPAKFSVPIVANGMVYAATLNGTIVGYGLLNQGTKTGEAPGTTSNALPVQSLQAIGLGAPTSLAAGNTTPPPSTGSAAGPIRLVRVDRAPGNDPNAATQPPRSAEDALAARLDRLYASRLALGLPLSVWPTLGLALTIS